jgi:SAM-dependent methyltransferase
VHALRKIHQVLVPGGILLDMHPIPPSTRAEVGGNSLGEFDDAEFMETVARTEAALDQTVAEGLFAFDIELEFDWLERFDSGGELIDDVESWGDVRIPADLAARVRSATPPVDLWERVVLRRFRACNTQA